MSKYISYESWEKDFFTIPNIEELENIMEKHGICDPQQNTASLLIFRQGGYIEQFLDGTYFVTLERTDVIDKDLNVIKRALYNWCDGECFNSHNGFKFGHYKSEDGIAHDLREQAILSDSYNLWLKKENLPKMDIQDLLYSFKPIGGEYLTDDQRHTLRSYEKLSNLIGDAFYKGDYPNAN